MKFEAMGKILGSDLLLGWKPAEGEYRVFGCSKSCEVSEERDTVEVSSPASGIWRGYVAGRCGWSCSCECLMSDDSDGLEEAFRLGKPVEVSMKRRNGQVRYSGHAIITSLKSTGRLHEMATYSVRLKGTGELGT